MQVNIAVGYGGRQEIADAVRELLRERAAAGASLEEVAASLQTKGGTRYSLRLDATYAGSPANPIAVARTSYVLTDLAVVDTRTARVGGTEHRAVIATLARR